MFEDVGQGMKARCVGGGFGGGGVFFHARAPLLAAWLLCLCSCAIFPRFRWPSAERDLIGGQSLRPLQLVQVGFRHHQLRWPLDFLLVLHVQLGDLNCFGCVDFVLRQEFAWA